MFSQKLLNTLKEGNREFAAMKAALAKVNSMNKPQLEELKTTGTTIEKNQAAFELMVRESDEYVSSLMEVAIKDTANNAFEKAFNDGFEKGLNKAGYKLVGHIEKIKS